VASTRVCTTSHDCRVSAAAARLQNGPGQPLCKVETPTYVRLDTPAHHGATLCLCIVEQLYLHANQAGAPRCTPATLHVASAPTSQRLQTGADCPGSAPCHTLPMGGQSGWDNLDVHNCCKPPHFCPHTHTPPHLQLRCRRLVNFQAPTLMRYTLILALPTPSRPGRPRRLTCH
jgi:hypothetical protein